MVRMASAARDHEKLEFLGASVGNSVFAVASLLKIAGDSVCKPFVRYINCRYQSV